MKQTEDIATLVDIAEAEFRRLTEATFTALNDLDRFWTRLYGPNEATSEIRDLLNSMTDEFFGERERQ